MVVYSHYPNDQRVRREAETLRDSGAIVDVICVRNKNEKRDDEHNSVTIYRVPMRIKKKIRGGYLMYIFRYLAFLILSTVLLTGLFVKKRYQVVHVHSIPDYQVFCTFIPKLFGARIILDLHELTPEVFATKFEIPMDSRKTDIAKYIEKFSVRFADLVITTNHLRRSIIVKRTQKREVAIVMNLPKRDIFVNKDMSDFVRKNDLKGSFIVSYIGGLNPERELDVVLRAIAYSKKRIPHLFLIIGGSGERDYLAMINKIIAEYDLKKNVISLDFVPLELILNYTRISNVAICPYRYNPNLDVVLSTKVFEYLLVPKPVIVAELSLMSKEFKDMVLFYKSSDHESLGDRIVEVYENEDKFIKMAQRAQDVLFKKYDPEKNEQGLVDLYKNLIRRKG
jgi:glycosyltransferase involved in cell wall biosynthesis